MDIRTKYMIVVLGSALIVAFESVVVEAAINFRDIDLFLISSLPLVTGGALLIALYPNSSVSFVRGLGRRGWTWMIALCAFGAVGALLWFDAVSRIGASKEALLGGGSSEVLFIVVLSAVFLGEKLKRWEILGSLLVLLGVFVVLANVKDVSLTVGFGELEAIASSFLLGISVVIATYLLRSHELTPLSGAQLLISGIMMGAFGLATGLLHMPDLSSFIIAGLIGIIPAFGLLAYNAGLPKIGASLTSVLFALTGIMTIGVELVAILAMPDADFILPESLAMGILGGVVAFAGVYLLNMKRG